MGNDLRTGAGGYWEGQPWARTHEYRAAVTLPPTSGAAVSEPGFNDA